MADLEQAGKEGDKVGPLVDILKRLQGAVHLLCKLLISSIASKE